MLLGASGQILEVNRALCQMLGYLRSELLDQNVRRFVPVEHWWPLREGPPAFPTSKYSEEEVWNRRKDGERCLLRIHQRPLQLPDGRPGVLLVARDITRSRQGERLREVFLSLAENLSRTRERQQAARAIFAAADKLWKWDCAVLDLLAPQSGRIETVLACDVIDGQRQEINPAALPTEISPRFRRVLTRGPELTLRPPQAARPSDTILFGDCSRLSASIMVVPVWTENQPVGVLSFQSYDFNAYTEEDLRTLQALADYCGGAILRIEAEAESHRLGQQLLQISEKEQARIGQDLHDGLCQNLVSLCFDANRLQSTLTAQARPEAPLARRLSEYLDQAITECRQVARGLFPVRLATEGLPPALEELVKTSSERYRTRCTFECPQPVPVADSTVATHLYRIAQEALTNALRHSRARWVTVRLQVRAAQIHLSVEDNGIGLSAAAQRRAKGLGLHIMNYRARTIGATLHIGPGRRGGTLVRCTMSRWGVGVTLP